MNLVTVFKSSLAALGLVATAPWWGWSSNWGYAPMAGAVFLIDFGLVVYFFAAYLPSEHPRY